METTDFYMITASVMNELSFNFKFCNIFKQKHKLLLLDQPPCCKKPNRFENIIILCESCGKRMIGIYDYNDQLMFENFAQPSRHLHVQS